jgi:hypothetical protein
MGIHPEDVHTINLVSIGRATQDTRSDGSWERDTTSQLGRTWLETQTVPPVDLVLDRIALYTWHDDRRGQQFKIVRFRRMDGGSV